MDINVLASALERQHLSAPVYLGLLLNNASAVRGPVGCRFALEIVRKPLELPAMVVDSTRQVHRDAALHEDQQARCALARTSADQGVAQAQQIQPKIRDH
jgi:hypothetical protein